MDLSYDTIPSAYGGMVKLYREFEKIYHVEDLRTPNNADSGGSLIQDYNAVLKNVLKPMIERAQDYATSHLTKKKRKKEI